MSERCPYCNSRNTVESDTNLTSYEYHCRSCKEKFEKTHVGGQILKGAGTVLSGVLLFWLMGDDDNS